MGTGLKPNDLYLKADHTWQRGRKAACVGSLPSKQFLSWCSNDDNMRQCELFGEEKSKWRKSRE